MDFFLISRMSLSFNISKTNYVIKNLTTDIMVTLSVLNQNKNIQSENKNILPYLFNKLLHVFFNKYDFKGTRKNRKSRIEKNKNNV